MKTIISTIILTAVLAMTNFAQTADKIKVTPITMPAGATAGEISGNINEGKKIALGWAERSSVACFPGTRFEMFNGNHVFYRITLPAASEINITVEPKDGKSINLYALRQGVAANAQTVPPDVTSAISCEASYPIYANLPGGRTVKNKDSGIRKVSFISVRSPYSILIGIAGARGLTEGDYKMKVEIKSR